MLPFLAMLDAAGPALGGVLPQKLIKFCDRMLGPAKSDEERGATLAFLRGTNLSIVDRPLAERVLELVPADDPLGEAARSVISQRGGS